MTRHSGVAAAAAGVLAGFLGLSTAQAAVQGAAWTITPAIDSCRAEIELAGRTGPGAVVRLESDGQRVALLFSKDNVPASAFLPIRIDQKPFANLVQRAGDARSAAMILSDATQAALRRGRLLQIAWLTDEVLTGSLGGSDQGIADLRTCGVQVAVQHRALVEAQAVEQARAEADARARAVSDQQLAAAKAQAAVAEAEHQRVDAEARRAAAEADRLSAEAERLRAVAEVQQRQAQAARWDEQLAPQDWGSYRQPQPYYRQPAPNGGRAYSYGDPRYDNYDDN